MKKLIAIGLALCLALCLCACGEDQPANTTPALDTTPDAGVTTPAPETTPEQTKDSGLKTYTVTVTDEAGNPISGAMVQICSTTCIPTKTDDQGIATWNVVPDNYKVSFLALPKGYSYTSDVQEFYFDEGTSAMTIVLKAEG